MSNIVKISTPKGYYIFDAIGNEFYQIEDKDIFDNITIYDIGYTSEKREVFNLDKPIKNQVLSEAKTLIIEITEECNMRCTYCVFDENDGAERNHSSKRIDQEKIKRNIDEFYRRTGNNDWYIIFYGGEPLINYSTIKQTVSYVNEKYRGAHFSFTTNGLLLTEEKFGFIVDNNFVVTLSIDGDELTHNKYRLNIGGLGTHEKIIKNLNSLRNYSESYFQNNVRINCVISSTDDLPAINKYFLYFGISEDSIRYSGAIKESDAIDRDIFHSAISKIENDTIANSPVEKSYINDVLAKIRFRSVDDKAGEGKKVCVPFSNRTYVRTSGEVQFCERIGNYGTLGDAGYVNRSSDLFDDFLAFKSSECSSCFAYNFCEMCPASFISNGGFDLSKAESKCSLFRDVVRYALYLYVSEQEIC